MTGKTHMAVSAATVAVVMAAMGARASKGIPHLLPLDPAGSVTPGISSASLHSIAGLLLLGIVAGLFPDLDAPDTELQHLPGRVAGHLGRYVTHIATRTPWIPRKRRSSIPVRLMQDAVRLSALPFSLLFGATGAVLRAATGHRGFTHTLLGALVFTTLAAGATMLATGSVRWAVTAGAVWLLGYASHLAADACTPSGIPLFWFPDLFARRGLMRKTRTRLRRHGESSGAGSSTMAHAPAAGSPSDCAFHLLPRRMRIRTGAPTDTLLVRWTSWAICFAAGVYMLTS